MNRSDLPGWPVQLSRDDKLAIVEFMEQLAVTGHLDRDIAYKLLPEWMLTSLRSYGLAYSSQPGNSKHISHYTITVLGRAWLAAVKGRLGSRPEPNGEA